jgi:hypothetical protein
MSCPAEGADGAAKDARSRTIIVTLVAAAGGDRDHGPDVHEVTA